MNRGVLLGFTRKSNIPPGEAYPRLQVRYDDRTSFWLSPGDINYVVCTTAATAVTVYVPRMGLVDGECIHVKQDGAGQVTFVADTGATIEVASTVTKTRAQNSIVTLMKENDTRQASQVWLLFGDFASS